MGVADLADYPWDAVAPYAERARSHPDGIVDLSIGSPVDAVKHGIAHSDRVKVRRCGNPTPACIVFRPDINRCATG